MTKYKYRTPALAVEDLISSKLNNTRKLARLTTHYSRGIYFPEFSEGTAFLLLQGVRENDSSFERYKFKYGKYDITSEKINNNKRPIDRAK